MKLAACIIAALAATSMAACPNQCSGHGKCSDNDVCECYKQTGTTWRQRAGYSGADCSQRTCPLGKSFDFLQTTEGNSAAEGKVKFTKGTKLDGSAADGASAADMAVIVAQNNLGKSRDFKVRMVADNKWQWKYAEQTSYTAQSATSFEACIATAPCELTGSGDATGTGVYIYSISAATTKSKEGGVYEFSVDHLEGDAYLPGNSNSAHMQVECSGRGGCDRASGRCTCFDGFSGEACQRTTCPSDCSGHGVCQSQKRFAADGGAATYATAYDANKEMGCLCDAGFRGPDCSSIECPSGADPMGGAGGDGASATIAMDCSGRGLCDYSSGDCGCFKGFYGERCEFQTNFV